MGEAALCQNCGEPPKEAARFCSGCGEPVVASKGSSPAPGPQAGGGGWKPSGQAAAGPGEARLGDPATAAGHRATFRALPSTSVVEGQARGLQSRSELKGENYQQEIWNFRVERYDDAGNRVLLVPVEMRGRSFEGSISDGEWVRVHGRYKRGTFRASVVDNLTTGATVRARGLPKFVTPIMVVFFVLVVSFIAWVAFSIFMEAREGPPDFPDPTELPSLRE